MLHGQKTPEATPLGLPSGVSAVGDKRRDQLPDGVSLSTATFRQADFIAAAVGNVGVALRDGAILVCIILLLFLGNGRAALISLAAIPTSLVAAVLAVAGLGLGIDTMTLGGLTIAIGSVVDDGIIAVYNVIRRLRQDEAAPAEQRRGALGVVHSASVGLRGSPVLPSLVMGLLVAALLCSAGVCG